MKTLIDSVSAEGMVGHIKMKAIKPENQDKVVVWVEGKDWRVYRGFFDPDKIIEAGKVGCKQIIEGHRKLKSKEPNKKSIVIVDSDFNRLEGKDLDADPNIFYTDGHDVEMMMMMSKKVRHRLSITFEFAKDCEHYFDEVFHDLHLLSYFKWYDHHHKRCYSYKPLGKVQQSQENLHNLEWIENKLHACSKLQWESSNHSTPFVPIAVDDVRKFINEHAPVDRYEITNGHDFYNRLCLHIKKMNKEYTRDEDSLKDSVLTSFDNEQFEKTKLHKSLRSWCDKNVDILSKAM